jgi:hypothetical protein
MRLLIIDYNQTASSVWGGRDRPEWVVGINRNRWSRSIGNGGRHQPEYAIKARISFSQIAIACKTAPGIFFQMPGFFANIGIFEPMDANGV